MPKPGEAGKLAARLEQGLGFLPPPLASLQGALGAADQLLDSDSAGTGEGRGGGWGRGVSRGGGVRLKPSPVPWTPFRKVCVFFTPSPFFVSTISPQLAFPTWIPRLGTDVRFWDPSSRFGDRLGGQGGKATWLTALPCALPARLCQPRGADGKGGSRLAGGSDPGEAAVWTGPPRREPLLGLHAGSSPGAPARSTEGGKGRRGARASGGFSSLRFPQAAAAAAFRRKGHEGVTALLCPPPHAPLPWIPLRELESATPSTDPRRPPQAQTQARNPPWLSPNPRSLPTPPGRTPACWRSARCAWIPRSSSDLPATSSGGKGR